MFNIEMVCSDGVFQLCDDIFSEKLTEKEAKECVRTFYKDLKNAESRVISDKDISFNVCTFWCNDEEKENIMFNITLIKDVMFNMANNIFNVFYQLEDMSCPKHWLTLNNTVIALINYKAKLFK